jgi:hypothetical protein
MPVLFLSEVKFCVAETRKERKEGRKEEKKAA